MNLENLKSFFSQLFTDLDTDDSIYILLFLTIAWLIGMLFGAMSRNRKIRRLKRMVKERDNDLITVRADNGALKEKLEISEERLQKAEADFEETNSLLGAMEQSRHAIHTELVETKEIASRLSAKNEAYSQEIDQLNVALAAFAGSGDSGTTTTSTSTDTGSVDTSGQTTTTSSGSTTSDGTISTDRLSSLEAKLGNLEDENIHLRSQLIDIKGQSGIVSDNSLAALKARLEQVELENDQLQKDLLGIKGGSASTATTVIDNTSTGEPTDTTDTITTILDDGASPKEREAKARASLNAAFGSRIKKETAANKSNLKLIAGIGPFIETKLNDIGIFTFEQITQLDDELIGYITDAIQFFPGRIQRDDWVGQAKKLLA